MMGDPLSIEEIRNLEKGDYIVIDLHEDEYWMQGEGEVSYVTDNQYGGHTVGIVSYNGRTSRLKVPEDGRETMKFHGAANGARNLRVSGVYER